MLTLGDIRQELYDTLGYPTTPDSATIRRLDGFVNSTQRELVPMRGLARLRRSVLPFTSVASNPFATLPQSCVRIAGIQDRTQQKGLHEYTLQEARHRDPGLTNVGSNPDGYIVIALNAALGRELSGADSVFIQSSGSDFPTAYAQCITEGGYPVNTFVTMSGTTPVSLGLTDIIQIQKLYLSAAAVGTITITQTSGAGTELARIAIGRRTPRYTKIQLVGTPSTAITYYADVDLSIETLVNEGDVPYLPEDFQWLYVCGGLAREYTKRKDWDAVRAELSRWKAGVAVLKGFCRQSTDDGYPASAGKVSQLGGYFPSGS